MLTADQETALSALYDSRTFVASKPGETVKLGNSGLITLEMLDMIAHTTEFRANLPEDYQIGNPLPTVIFMEYSPVLPQ